MLKFLVITLTKSGVSGIDYQIMPAFLLLLVAALLATYQAAIPVTPNMKSFSHAIKDGRLVGVGVENVIFSHTSGPGVITEQWTAGKGCMDELAVMRVYVDGETIPSLDFNMYLAHGIGKDTYCCMHT